MPKKKQVYTTRTQILSDSATALAISPNARLFVFIYTLGLFQTSRFCRVHCIRRDRNATFHWIRHYNRTWLQLDLVRARLVQQGFVLKALVVSPNHPSVFPCQYPPQCTCCYSTQVNSWRQNVSWWNPREKMPELAMHAWITDNKWFRWRFNSEKCKFSWRILFYFFL